MSFAPRIGAFLQAREQYLIEALIEQAAKQPQHKKLAADLASVRNLSKVLSAYETVRKDLELQVTELERTISHNAFLYPEESNAEDLVTLAAKKAELAKIQHSISIISTKQ